MEHFLAEDSKCYSSIRKVPQDIITYSLTQGDGGTSVSSEERKEARKRGIITNVDVSALGDQTILSWFLQMVKIYFAGCGSGC